MVREKRAFLLCPTSQRRTRRCRLLVPTPPRGRSPTPASPLAAAGRGACPSRRVRGPRIPPLAVAAAIWWRRPSTVALTSPWRRRQCACDGAARYHYSCSPRTAPLSRRPRCWRPTCQPRRWPRPGSRGMGVSSPACPLTPGWPWTKQGAPRRWWRYQHRGQGGGALSSWPRFRGANRTPALPTLRASSGLPRCGDGQGEHTDGSVGKEPAGSCHEQSSKEGSRSHQRRQGSSRVPGPAMGLTGTPRKLTSRPAGGREVLGPAPGCPSTPDHGGRRRPPRSRRAGGAPR